MRINGRQTFDKTSNNNLMNLTLLKLGYSLHLQDERQTIQILSLFSGGIGHYLCI
jgi:hypothetical protein